MKAFGSAHKRTRHDCRVTRYRGVKIQYTVGVKARKAGRRWSLAVECTK